MKKLHFIWLNVAVLLLAAFLRIDGLNAQGLWGDEGWSVEFSASANPQDVVLALVPDLHPPLYFIGLALWREVAGDSEIALRIPAVFAGLLTVAVLSRLAGTYTAGVIAALFLAIADKHIVLSQEVRHYPLAFMLMALTSWFFVRFLKQPSRRNTLVYALLIMLSVYTHYYTALILPVQALYVIWLRRDVSWRVITVMAVSMLAFLPWVFVAIYQLQIRPEGILHSMPLEWATLEFLSVDFLGRPPALAGILLLIGIGLAIRKQSPAGIYATLWFALPVTVTLSIYPVVTLITDRNLALLLLPIALLCGQATAYFPFPGRWIMAVLVLSNGLTSLDSYYDHPPWREMAQYVASNYPAGEPVFMDVVGGDKALGYHLWRELPPGTEIVSINQLRIDQGVFFLGVWDQYLQQNDGFWVAYWVDENRDSDIVEPMESLGYVRTATNRHEHSGTFIEWYHYDQLPALDETLTRYDNRIRLHRVKYPSVAYDVLDVSIWWSTAESLETSYSVSVFLLDDAGRLVQQHDSAPQNGAAPTNGWAVDHIVLDTHRLSLNNVSAGTYRLAIKIYDSATLDVLPAGQAADEYFIVDTVTVN